MAENGSYVRLIGPLQIARARVDCWKCGHETTVVTIIANQVEAFEEGISSGSSEEAAFVYDIPTGDIPVMLTKALQLHAPHFKPTYSRTMDETTWANTCEHCEALQGAFYLHSEPEGPFFAGPSNFDGERVELHAEDVQIREASYSM